MSQTELIDSCLLVNRRIKDKKDQSVTLTEITQRSVTSSKMASLINDGSYTRQNSSINTLNSSSNNYAENSPNSSHISLHSDESLMQSHKQQTTQQSTTLTKVVCEMQHSIKNNSPIDYQTLPIGMYPQQVPVSHVRQQQPYTEYSSLLQQYDPHLYSHLPDHKFNQISESNFKDYGTYPTSEYLLYNDRPITPSEQSISPTPLVQHSEAKSGTYLSNYGDYYHIMTAAAAAAAASAVSTAVTTSVSNNQNDTIDHCTMNDNAILYGYTTSPYGTTNNSHLVNTIYGTRASVAAAQYNDTLKSNGSSNIMYEEDLQKHFNQQLDFHKQQSQQQQSHHPLVTTTDVNLHPNYPGGLVGAPVTMVIDDKQQRTMHWRDPNLTEVINFLNNSNNIIKANAAAYLQHLCYMDDQNKQKTRMLGGIPPLIKLLLHDNISVHRNACGALRNISYGRQNDENKRAIRNAGGLKALVTLLQKTTDSEVKELLTGVIWNMSSCEDLKKDILDDVLDVLVNEIIIQHSGWNYQPNLCNETCFSTIFRNASGVLRNISSAGEYGRKKLRECANLIDSLVYVLKFSIEKLNIGNKIVENACCILRNLSYRCQEIEDPNYDKNMYNNTNTGVLTQSRLSAANIGTKNENLGCFGTSKKKKDNSQQQLTQHQQNAENSNNSVAEDAVDILNTTTVSNQNYIYNSNNNKNNSLNNMNVSTNQQLIKTGAELLWQPELVQLYLTLLQSCSNPETLEAAAGAIQNLAACYWQPSIDVRATVRKEKGLPILVELLRMEVDRVVCAVATALRNLAIDQRNKELIGKYAMRDLVQKLPLGNSQHDYGTSDDTIAAVLATLNEVIKKNAEFSRSLLETGGVERLLMISKNRQKYTPRVIKFSSQLLFTMWQHQELREVYKKHGWKEQDFVPKTVISASSTSTSTSLSSSVVNSNSISNPIVSSNMLSANNFVNSNSPNNTNNTLNRPMASQSATRYEDRTIKRVYSTQRSHNTDSPKNEEIPLGDVNESNRQYSSSSSVSNYRMFPPNSTSHQSLD